MGLQKNLFPLLERKRQLRTIVPASPSPLLYVDHVVKNGTALYRAVCERDLEGIVASVMMASTAEPEWRVGILLRPPRRPRAPAPATAPASKNRPPARARARIAARARGSRRVVPRTGERVAPRGVREIEAEWD